METVICDPRGDAFLVTPDNFQIRVSTKALGLASPVFSAMFDGRFAEGQNLSSTAPPKITLEDDGKPLAMLCTTFHWNEPYIFSPDIEDLFKLASTADKYACHIIIGPAFRVDFMQKLEDLKYLKQCPDILALHKFIWSTYVLGLLDLCWEASRILVMSIENPAELFELETSCKGLRVSDHLMDCLVRSFHKIQIALSEHISGLRSQHVQTCILSLEVDRSASAIDKAVKSAKTAEIEMCISTPFTDCMEDMESLAMSYDESSAANPRVGPRAYFTRTLTESWKERQKKIAELNLP